MLIILIGLGTWQLQRLQWKEGLIAERTALLEQAPLVLTSINDNVAEYRRVRVSGVLLTDKSLFVGPVSYKRGPGWYLVTPLRLMTGGIILINRGWIAYDKRDVYRDAAAGAGKQISFDAISRRSGKLGAFIPENVPEKDQWYLVDPEGMAQHLGLGSVASFWLIVRATPGQRSSPKPVGDIVMPVNNHLQYVMTWYGLALVLMVIGALYWRKEKINRT
jgi:surfeit locus 1 family protein